MLDLESRLHSEGRALLDSEGVLVELFKSARLGEVDNDVLAARDLQSEREDDDFPRVVGVRDGVSRADPQGFLPFPERFVVLVYEELVHGSGKHGNIHDWTCLVSGIRLSSLKELLAVAKGRRP